MATPLDPELVDQIRESLYAGRGVRLVGDEPPVAKLDTLTPMTADGEAFLNAKLEKVAELLDRGFIVNIDSDGSILAQTPDHRSRYISTQEAEIDVMDRLMVKAALEQGATVAFEADGSLAITAAATPTLPNAAHAAAQFAEFERIADAGDINAEIAAGRDFTFDASAVPDPAPAPVVEDPFDTAAELEAEADALQLGIDAARDLSLPEYVAGKEAAELERLDAEGRLAMARAQHDTALQQASASNAAAFEVRESASYQRALAQELRDAGDEAQADAHDADAINLEAVALVHANVAAAATATADAADERITAETEAVDSSTAASVAVNTQHSGRERVFGEQEDQVSNARAAAAELAEAERLEAALPDLEARGVEGLERVRSAIAEHRAAAEALVEQGNLRATTGIVLEGSTDPDVIDPDVVDPIDFELGIFDRNLVEQEPVEQEPVDQGFSVGDDGADFNMADPDLIRPPQVTLDPLEPRPTDPLGATPDPIEPDEIEPDEFEPAPIGPEAFEIKDPMQFDASAEVPLDLDDAGADGSMSAPVDDFASDIADIAEMEDDLDGLADF